MNSNYKDYYNNFGSLKFEKKKWGPKATAFLACSQDRPLP